MDLNSACNCCETIPYPALKLEARSKGTSVTGCGYADPEGEEGVLYRQITTTYTAPGPALQLWVGVGLNAGEEYYAEINEGDTVEMVFRSVVTEDGCGCIQGEYSGFFWDDMDAGYTSEEVYEEVVPVDEVIGRGEDCLDLLELGAWGEWFFAAAEKRYSPHYYSRSVSELRLKHPPTVTGYLKIWLWQRKFTISTSGEFVSQELSPFDEYVWTGEPSNLNLGVNAEENRITSSVFEIITEDINTRIDIFIGKWSLIPEYEPADPILDPNNSDPSQVNPDFPSWTRPNPDCFSNGTPTVNETCPASLFV